MTKRLTIRDARWWIMGGLAAIGVSIGAVAAVADVSPQQDTNAHKLARRLDADEVQARALEARMFIAQQRPKEVRVADLFGESDEEKAARLQKEQDQDASIAQLNQRVGDLEASLRRLTGQMEQLDHRLSEVNAKIDRMQKDFDYKLCTITAQQLGAGTGEGGLPCGGSSSSDQTMMPGGAPPGPAAPSSSAGLAPVHLAPPPGVLGTLPSNSPMPLPAPAADDSTPPQDASAKPLGNRAAFDAAMGLLSKAQYDEARAGFRSYADTYPKDMDLAPQAVYWVGDIAYVQKDYPNAARAFVEEIKKYGSSPRAPDSMLKLGQSLIAMNQKPQGCTTLEALPSKYPQASKAVLAQATAVRKTAGCK